MSISTDKAIPSRLFLPGSSTMRDGDGADLTLVDGTVKINTLENNSKIWVSNVPQSDLPSKNFTSLGTGTSPSTFTVVNTPTTSPQLTVPSLPYSISGSFIAGNVFQKNVGNYCDDLHNFQGKGNMNGIIESYIKTWNANGIKVRPYDVKVNVSEPLVSWTASFEESNYNYLGFTSRGAGCNRDIFTRAGSNDPAINNGTNSIRDNLVKQGKILNKIEEVSTVNYFGTPTDKSTSFVQIFYRYSISEDPLNTDLLLSQVSSELPAKKTEEIPTDVATEYGNLAQVQSITNVNELYFDEEFTSLYEDTDPNTLQSQPTVIEEISSGYEPTFIPVSAGGTGIVVGGNEGSCKRPSGYPAFIPKTTTKVPPAEAARILNELYPGDTNKPLRRFVLFILFSEQGQGINGFNYNFGGVDITAGGWTYNPTYMNGYTCASEPGTKNKHAFVSFKDAKSGIQFVAEQTKKKISGFETKLEQKNTLKSVYGKDRTFGVGLPAGKKKTVNGKDQGTYSLTAETYILLYFTKWNGFGVETLLWDECQTSDCKSNRAKYKDIIGFFNSVLISNQRSLYNKVKQFIP